MRYDVEEKGTVLYVRFYEMLDSDEAPDLREALRKYLEKGGHNLVLDLSEVELVTTPGLGLLVSLRKRVGERDAEITLSGLKPYIKEIFDLTRLSRIFNVVDSAE